jgi:hypothetical protein
MAYFYIKSGGTATGDGGRYASYKTGSWSTAFTATSQYYNSIADLETSVFGGTSPTLGDYIIFSHLHNDTSSASNFFNITDSGDTNNQYISVVSVDDSDVTKLKVGAQVDGASSYYLSTGICYIFGLVNLPEQNFTHGIANATTFSGTLKVCDNVFSQNSSTSNQSLISEWLFYKYIDYYGINVFSSNTGNGRFVNCEIGCNSNGFFPSGNAACVDLVGCTFVNASSIVDLSQYNSNTRGNSFNLIGSSVPINTTTYSINGTTQNSYAWVNAKKYTPNYTPTSGYLFKGSSGSYTAEDVTPIPVSRYSFYPYITDNISREYGATSDGEVGISTLLYGNDYTDGSSKYPVCWFITHLWEDFSSSYTFNLYGRVTGSTCTLKESEVWLEAYYKGSSGNTWLYTRSGPSIMYVPGATSASSISDNTQKWRESSLETWFNDGFKTKIIDWNGSYNNITNGFKISISAGGSGSFGPCHLILRSLLQATGNSTKTVLSVCPKPEY